MNNSKRCFVFLAILMAATSILRAQAYRVVGYYPMWTRATLPASSVKYGFLTHINHAFAWPNADGSISSNETAVDTALINTTHRAGRKILLSFGGAGTAQTVNFAIVAADSALRRTFVNNVLARIVTYHYDGADLDWEGPASRGDKANEVALVQQLRAAFQTANTSLLITMAIGASDWSGQWRDYASLSPYVDWFNAMEYDFHGSWSRIAGHNAPLYAGTNPVSDPDYYSIDQSVQYLTVTRAIPKEKLTLGLPFYGKSFGTSTLYASFTGEQDLAYRDIISAVQVGSWTYIWDVGSQVPYYSSISPPGLISLDDSASIANKCQYVRNKGLSGVMIWELSQDVIGLRQPLMDAIGSQMGPATGVVVTQSGPLPSGPVLYDNYPNPFNPSTVISFQLSTISFVTLKVFDILGREVATLTNEVKGPGVWSVRFDASAYNLASGVYLYRLDAGSFIQTKRLVFVK